MLWRAGATYFNDCESSDYPFYILSGHMNALTLFLSLLWLHSSKTSIIDSWACVHCVLSSSSVHCKVPSLNSPSNSVCIHSIHTCTLPFNRPVIDKIGICLAMCVCLLGCSEHHGLESYHYLSVMCVCLNVCVWQRALSRVRQWCNAYPTAHLERCRGQVQIEPLCTALSRPQSCLLAPTKGASVLVWAFVYGVVTRWSICRTLHVFYRETLMSVQCRELK